MPVLLASPLDLRMHRKCHTEGAEGTEGAAVLLHGCCAKFQCHWIAKTRCIVAPASSDAVS
jgi:hypothetical protein